MSKLRWFFEEIPTGVRIYGHVRRHTIDREDQDYHGDLRKKVGNDLSDYIVH